MGKVKRNFVWLHFFEDFSKYQTEQKIPKNDEFRINPIWLHSLKLDDFDGRIANGCYRSGALKEQFCTLEKIKTYIEDHE